MRWLLILSSAHSFIMAVVYGVGLVNFDFVNPSDLFWLWSCVAILLGFYVHWSVLQKGNETHMSEYERTETETNLKTEAKTKRGGGSTLKERGEVSWGVRALMTSPLPACEKLDKMFGSGGEAIVHHMWFESGQSLFDNMIECNTGKSLEELLKALIEAQLCTGWGHVSMKIIHNSPPMVDITVKNSPVKTVKGSQKYLICSFWAGVLSKYFNRQLMCKSFGYDSGKDEFSCTVTV